MNNWETDLDSFLEDAAKKREQAELECDFLELVAAFAKHIMATG